MTSGWKVDLEYLEELNFNQTLTILTHDSTQLTRWT
jgi:hypothetical protein